MSNRYDTIEYRGFNINIYLDDMAEDPRDWDNIGTMYCVHRDYPLGDPLAHDGHNKPIYPRDAEDVVEYMLAAATSENKAARIREVWENGRGGSKKFNGFIKAGLYICSHLLPIIIPLYLLDHSGLRMSAGKNMDLSCRRYNHFGVDPGAWDTSMVGFIFCTWKDVEREYGVDVDTELGSPCDRAEKYLRGEVEVYDQYLSGSVFWYRIEPKAGNKIECDDSCGGFYGDEWDKNGLFDMAENSINHTIHEYCKQVVGKHAERVQMQRFMQKCWAD